MKTGRPRKPTSERCSEVLVSRLPPPEAEAAYRLASQSRQSISSLVRTSLRHYAHARATTRPPGQPR